MTRLTFETPQQVEQRRRSLSFYSLIGGPPDSATTITAELVTSTDPHYLTVDPDAKKKHTPEGIEKRMTHDYRRYVFLFDKRGAGRYVFYKEFTNLEGKRLEKIMYKDVEIKQYMLNGILPKETEERIYGTGSLTGDRRIGPSTDPTSGGGDVRAVHAGDEITSSGVHNPANGSSGATNLADADQHSPSV
jgi:hypothetical protein